MWVTLLVILVFGMLCLKCFSLGVEAGRRREILQRQYDEVSETLKGLESLSEPPGTWTVIDGDKGK